ncbi:hypothetical protein M422DRAFT_246322 [Sphaerobolus stellatus SS14]|nr:hypothetical protein M422DRAFT_246322 [Sphaerobolus stellatus SS14]
MDTSMFLTARSLTAGLRGKTLSFGCIAYALIPKDKRESKKAYRLYDPVTKTVFTTRPITFDEDCDLNAGKFVGKTPEDEDPASEKWEDILRRQTVFGNEPKLTVGTLSDKTTSESVGGKENRENSPDVDLSDDESKPNAPDNPPSNYRKRKALRTPPDPTSMANSRAKRTVKVADQNRELRRVLLEEEERQAERAEQWRAKRAKTADAPLSSEQIHQSLLDIQPRAQNPTHDESDYYSEPESEDPPSDVDDIFFAVIGSTGPSNEDLPKDLRDTFVGKEESNWRSALNEEL